MPRPTASESGRTPLRGHPDTMRLFVAVALPDSTRGLVATLPRPDRPGLRWTTPAQWHVTLRFIGQARSEQVVAAAAEAPGLLIGGSKPVAELGPATAWFAGRRVLQVPVKGLEPLA